MSQNNAEKEGYKKTSLGWIPNEWDVKIFSDTFDFINTNSLSRDQLTLEKTESGIFNIHYGDIHAKFKSELLDFDIEIGIPCIKDEVIISENANFLREGDLIIADASEDYEGVGKSIELKNIAGKKVLGGLHTIVARERYNETALGFRTYILNNQILIKETRRIATGTSVYGITKNGIGKLKLILPPLPEQKKIAIILSTWDAAITKTQQLIAQLQLRNKGLMQELLTGKKRFRGFEKDWKEIYLEDAFTERNEVNTSNLTLLSITQDRGVIYQTESDKKDTSNEDKSKYRRICPNDIGYNTMRMWQGRSALSNLEGMVSPAYTIVTPKSNQHALFYSYLIKLPFMVYKFFRKSQGLVDDTLNCKYKDFAKVKTFVPEYDEQIVIAELINKTFEEVKVYEQKLSALQLQKKGLMQKLLTGEVRVKI